MFKSLKKEKNQPKWLDVKEVEEDGDMLSFLQLEENCKREPNSSFNIQR